MRGFTLIELLIVVAIIGILAALLIPNALAAIQKAKQKTAMKEIMTISTGAMDYITDHGNWDRRRAGRPSGRHTADSSRPSPTSTSRPARSTTRGTTPTTSSAARSLYRAALSGADADNIGDEDFVMSSYGRNKLDGPFNAATYRKPRPKPASTTSAACPTSTATWSLGPATGSAAPARLSSRPPAADLSFNLKRLMKGRLRPPLFLPSPAPWLPGRPGYLFGHDRAPSASISAPDGLRGRRVRELRRKEGTCRVAARCDQTLLSSRRGPGRPRNSA